MRKEEVEGREDKEGLRENESEAEEVRGHWCREQAWEMGGAIYRKSSTVYLKVKKSIHEVSERFAGTKEESWCHSWEMDSDF